MPTSASAPDATTLLDNLSFNSEELREAKAAVHELPEFRTAIQSALRECESASGEAGSSLRHALLHYLVSHPMEALRVLGDDESPQATLLRGLSALELGDPGTAAAAFASLVGTSMEGESFLASLATAAALSGDTAMAQKAAAKLPDGADALYAEGIAFESDGEYGEACRKYEDALNVDPNHSRSLFRLAHRLDTEGKDDKAMEYYARCIALDPAHANALQNLALLYEDHDRYQEAESCYRRVLAADPEHVRARIGLKDVLSSQSMYYDEDHQRREDRRVQVMCTPISEFELSVRSRNCLAKMNIQSLGDLVHKTEVELLAYKNFGETSLQEIKDILAQKGLNLGMPTEDDAPLRSGSGAMASGGDDQIDALFGAPSAPVGLTDPTALMGAGGPEAKEVSIEKLDLSIRARRCVDNLEIRTIGDLISHSEAQLLASKNFGQTSLNEVRRKLEAFGLTLRRK